MSGGSGGALRSIFALFDVSTGDAETKLDKLNAKTSVVKDTLSALAGTLLGAFSLHGLTSFLESQIELGSVLNDTSERLGLATDDLQRFQFAAKLSGVDAEAAAHSLGFLNKNMGEALGGNKDAAKTFADLGISLKDGKGDVRELGDVIPEVADAFAKMGSDQERTAKAMQIFGRSGASLIPLLKGGSGELSKLNQEFTDLGLGIDEDFIKKADDAGDRIDTLKLGFRALKTRIAVEFLPSITEAARGLSKCVVWVQKLTSETNIVREGIGTLGVAGAFAAGKLAYSWSKVLGLFPKGGDLLGNLFKMGQVGLIVGAVVFLGVAIEDIVTMCQGGQSVIGDFLDKFLGVDKKTELVNTLTQAWADMQPALEQLGPLVGDIGTSFGKALPYAIGLVVDLLKVVVSAGIALEKVGEVIGELATGGGWEGVSRAAERQGEQQRSLWKGGSTLFNMINAPASVPASAAGGAAQAGAPVELNANNYFQIIGSTDPAETGKRVAGFQRDNNEKMVADAANALARGTP